MSILRLPEVLRGAAHVPVEPLGLVAEPPGHPRGVPLIVLSLAAASFLVPQKYEEYLPLVHEQAAEDRVDHIHHRIVGLRHAQGTERTR